MLSCENEKFKDETFSNSTQTNENEDPSIENSKELNLKLNNDVTLLFNQLTTTQNHLIDVLEENTKLRNDLKIAETCIHQEIGENVTLASLTYDLNSNGSLPWCGRAKKIVALEQSLVDLKKELERTQNRSICKSESKIRQELDKTEKDLSIAMCTIDEQIKKINALKARNKVLALDLTDFKAKQLRYDEQTKLHENQLNSFRVNAFIFLKSSN